MLGERRFGFADFAASRQYVTLGNLSENDRAFLFLIDYENAQRIKLWGRARVVEDHPELVETLRVDGASGRAERAILFEIVAWDKNCPQHISARMEALPVLPHCLLSAMSVSPPWRMHWSASVGHRRRSSS
ncbi:pyridoxamine 5'-phosphate oxidase family protein [Breoghania sp.]|uniref:pyridoxamine 5'-phosphate oxidase family protein n=1 Tax=Breoghania sp. TaxID=2065378 RepID=UPI0026339836|nr:pyridoxamine 5'-phosphate oxidase family protein [Breoghania sp.]MDJ0933592.1 pyridoxamine 5'-phosphate oxidase family protein [Breoghania sp.]